MNLAGALVLAGPLLGALLLIYLLTLLWERLLFMNVLDDPLLGKMSSVLAAFLTALILSSFISSHWERGLFYYAWAAFIVGAFGVLRGLRLRSEIADEAE